MRNLKATGAALALIILSGLAALAGLIYWIGSTVGSR